MAKIHKNKRRAVINAASFWAGWQVGAAGRHGAASGDTHFHRGVAVGLQARLLGNRATKRRYKVSQKEIDAVAAAEHIKETR